MFANYFGSASTHSLIVVDYIVGSLMGLLFWLFSREVRWKALSERPTIIPKMFSLVVITALICILIGLIISGAVISENTGSTSAVDNGPLYMTYPIMIFALVLLSVGNLLMVQIGSRDTLQKTRVKLVMAGIVVAFICIAIPNFILQNILPEGNRLLVAAYDLSYVGILAFLVISTYAIIKHGLFDIKLAAVRSAAYILVIVTLTVIYYAIAYVASLTLFKDVSTSALSLSPVNFLIALILAFVLQPIKRFFDRMTNSIFYKDNYKSDEFFAKLSELLLSTKDLRGLLERASEEIATTLKAEHTSFFLYYVNETRHHLSAGTKGHARLALHDADLLQDYAKKTDGGIFLTNFLDENQTLLKRMLVSHGVALVMPLGHGDEVVGFVMLGDHRSGSYTKRDLNVLQAVSNELLIAVQNALSLHEVKELNATLQQRIDVATKELRSSNNQLKHLDEVKDEFISMASHQLRTPLTSVKGYLSMVLDGDAGAVTPRQQTLLREAFNSSERMVRLIADFLNVSRLQTGKFTIDKKAIDFKNLVKQEVTNLELIAKTRGMKLRINVTDKDLPVVADEAKLQQVVMNFIDNAIYYSRPKGTIIINLERIKHSAVLTVVDTGIGVPEEEQTKLFHKFYRAKNARRQRPDGTGVGLFMARRVVEAHGGTIIFSSREGKGSTFGFRMPLDESEHGQ
jgi:signal transduction histidine kinase